MPTAATEIRLHAFVPAAPTPQALPRAEPITGPVVRVRVWDLPTRVFHWALVASLVGLAATGYAGGAWIDWHARLGSLVLALLLFRVVWGVVGGRWSRFRSFLPTPKNVMRYLRGKATPEQEAGHSPLGALSLLAMLLMLLNAWVSSSVGETATMLHKAYGQWMLLGLVLLHIAAIVFYRIARKRKLVQAMIGGDKLLPAARAVPPARDDAGTRILGAAVLCASLFAVWMLTGF
jgi:cytochrome b